MNIDPKSETQKPDDKLKWPVIASEDALRTAKDDNNHTVVNGKSEFCLGWRLSLEWVQKNYDLTPKPLNHEQS